MGKEEHSFIKTLPVAVVLLLAIVLPAGVPLTSAQREIPRNKIVWGCGYWPDESNFNPVTQLEGACGWDVVLMYEPMFGVDAASGQLIKELGESIEWINDGLGVKVTLRSGIYWVKITDWSAWSGTTEVSTAGVEQYRPITTEDVKYSFFLYGAFPDSPPSAYYMGGLKTRMREFEIVDERTFIVHLKDEYRYSSVVWRTLTRAYPILPKDVWEEVYAGSWDNINAFTNDWAKPDFPAEWRVASGMYLPWYHDPVRKAYTIMKKNPLWWGKNVLGEPAPDFFGYRGGNYYGSNEAIYADLQAGMIDWDGNYVPPDVWQKPGFLHTYFKNPPYFPESSTLLLVPNHRKYPLCEPWLRKAITMVIDYEKVNLASAGYLFDPSPLLLPWTDAAARELVNSTLEREYILKYGTYSGKNMYQYAAQAIAILSEHCIKVGDSWYTKDGPSMDWVRRMMDYYGDIDLVVGKVKKKASWWLANGFTIADQLPDQPGVNVKLGESDIGTWAIMDIVGWTDVNAIDLAVAESVSRNLGIPMTIDFKDWGGYTGAMDANTYDFADYCMHAGINNDMYERYTQMFVGTYSGCWNHYGSYVNPELIELIESLDTATGAERRRIAQRIQEIILEELPIIPEGGHPNWYIYSTKYWEGWPNEDKPLLP
ncbi:MAG: ABC transporter substrate-binding protein, partial [Thermoproteota archaeon]